MIETPKLWRIIWTDYTAFMAFLLPVVFGGIYIVLRLTGDGSGDSFVYLALAIGVAAVVLLAWRLQTITSVFREGVELPAVVSGVGFFRDRGTIACIYTFHGQKYESANTVHKAGRVKSFVQGRNVTALVNTANPKAAFIKELYL